MESERTKYSRQIWPLPFIQLCPNLSGLNETTLLISSSFSFVSTILASIAVRILDALGKIVSGKQKTTTEISCDSGDKV